MRAIHMLALFLLAALALSPALHAGRERPPTAREIEQMLEALDERQRNSGDYRWEGMIYQQERGKAETAYQALVFRRDEEDKLMILFTAPRTEAGKGYLRIDQTLFRYDPTIGRWERTTERERILGTNTRRADFDESRLAEEYAASYVGEEALGAYTVDHLLLQARPASDVAYPRVELWLDQATGNTLKRQDFSASGKLLRTLYLPTWNRYYSESKGDDVYVPAEIRVYDELEVGTYTIVTVKNVDLRPLPANLFTKAWLESQSR